jgi:hypothetical protein
MKQKGKEKLLFTKFGESIRLADKQMHKDLLFLQVEVTMPLKNGTNAFCNHKSQSNKQRPG